MDRPSLVAVGLLCLVASLGTADAQIKAQAPVVIPPTTVPRTTTQPAPVIPLIPVAPPPVQVQLAPLKGFVDLHAHPMAHLGFGGKIISGVPDADPNGNGAIITAVDSGSSCQHSIWQNGVWTKTIRATSEQQALGPENAIHGGPDINPSANPCGNLAREPLIHALQSFNGANDPPDSTYTLPGSNPPNGPSFQTWPAWNDLTRQKMWVEWIRRAYNGGQRVMVALAVNNKLLADAITVGNVTSVPDLPTDDATSADIQIAEMKRMVANSNFMAIAYKSADVYNIVSSGKLAVVLGVEIDHIGNLTGAAPASAVVAEIDRLYAEGVRYIFPVHLTDNPIGGAAAYNDLFLLANLYEEGHVNNLVCTQPAVTGIHYVPVPAAQQFLVTLANIVHLPLPASTQCPVVNGLGLTGFGSTAGAGQAALHEMMKKGMLIDIDHMSEAGYRTAIAYAQNYGYPLNSGHNGVRDPNDSGASERSFPADVYAAIGRLHGMAGVGSAKLDAYQWFDHYNKVISAMNNNGTLSIVGAFGTDLNGLEFGMPPRQEYERDTDTNASARNQCSTACANPASSDCGTNSTGKALLTGCVTSCQAKCGTTYPVKKVCTSFCGIAGPNVYSAAFTPATDSGRTWNYNTEGVAHYGMLPDFVQDVRSLPNGAQMIDNNFMFGADYFFHTWAIAEQKGAVMP